MLIKWGCWQSFNRCQHNIVQEASLGDEKFGTAQVNIIEKTNLKRDCERRFIIIQSVLNKRGTQAIFFHSSQCMYQQWVTKLIISSAIPICIYIWIAFQIDGKNISKERGISMPCIINRQKRMSQAAAALRMKLCWCRIRVSVLCL